jgi:hypothetical protein
LGRTRAQNNAMLRRRQTTPPFLLLPRQNKHNQNKSKPDEPALDYQISLVGALAGAAAGAAAAGPDYPSWEACKAGGFVFPLPRDTGFSALDADVRAGAMATAYQVCSFVFCFAMLWLAAGGAVGDPPSFARILCK